MMLNYDYVQGPVLIECKYELSIWSIFYRMNSRLSLIIKLEHETFTMVLIHMKTHSYFCLYNVH